MSNSTENTIPEGWEETSLLNISKVYTGKKDANFADEKGEYHFFTCAYEPLKSSSYSFEGDVLILPGNGVNVGEVFFYSGKFEAYQRTYIIDEIKISPKFLYYHFKNNWRTIGTKKQFGSATNYIKMGNFKDYKVYYPSEPEQEKIVKKLDAIFTELDTLKTQIISIPQAITKARQAILHQAVTGELTKEWRKGKELGEWEEKQFLDVLDIISGKNQKEVKVENGKYPIYGSGGIFGYANDYRCEAGTTIIGRKGTINSPIYVDEKFWNVDTAFGLSPNIEVLQSKFLFFFCCQFNFLELDKSTTIPSLAKRDLLLIEIKIPLLKEQQEIVKRVETLFTELDKIENHYNQLKEQLENLPQAILHKAFKGELV